MLCHCLVRSFQVGTLLSLNSSFYLPRGRGGSWMEPARDAAIVGRLGKAYPVLSPPMHLVLLPPGHSPPFVFFLGGGFCSGFPFYQRWEKKELIFLSTANLEKGVKIS